MAFNRKQRLRDNIEAIRTAFILDRERRTATAEEQAILRKYCGFGGLKCILNPAKELTDAVHWAKSDLELFAPTVELHRLVRENSKDDTEYKRYADAMKQSVLTAFYTPPARLRRLCMNTAYVPTVCWSRRRAWAHSWMPCWKTSRTRTSWLSRKT